MLLSAEHLSKNYGMKQLLCDESFYLSEGEKIGIIGINGTGKSTLLRILAQQEEPDGGIVWMQPQSHIGFLPQNPPYDAALSVLEQVQQSMAIPEEFAPYEAKSMLGKLGITNWEQPMGTLSGGQRKRVALAAVLLRNNDILILDEPTNHLDSFMAEWLEDYLRRAKCGVIFITHDRYFLERVSNRIVELDRGRLYGYEGNYETYLALKAEREEMMLATERKRQAILKKELAWISRGARARTTKAKGRIERYETLKAQEAPPEKEQLELFTAASRLGKKTVELVDVSKQFGSCQVLSHFSYIIKRTDRIGIVGRNGIGKSTLLNLISGRLLPDEGEVICGSTVKIGYFSQESQELPLQERVIDFIRDINNRIETKEGTFTATQMLERFLFYPELQYAKIEALSGGEKRRLFLLSILVSAPNILLLDEPTNDLDIETLSILEDYLEGFAGAVLAVSHDRYFLDKMADFIFEVEEDGIITPYVGNYSDYRQKKPALPAAEKDEKEEKTEKKQPQKRARALKFSYHEQREYETIGQEVEALEAKVADVEAQMEAAFSDYAHLETLSAEKAALEEALQEKMERWLYLEELAEKIAAQNEKGGAE